MNLTSYQTSITIQISDKPLPCTLLILHSTLYIFFDTYLESKKPTKGNSKTKIFLNSTAGINLSSDKFGDELNKGYN